MFVAVDGEPAGPVAFADTVREESREAIECLHRLGIEVAMLTGDNRQTAEAIAGQLGIDRVLAEVRPADKANEAKRLQAEGRKVGMVGDGIDDALATEEIPASFETWLPDRPASRPTSPTEAANLISPPVAPPAPSTPRRSLLSPGSGMLP